MVRGYPLAAVLRALLIMAMVCVLPQDAVAQSLFSTDSRVATDTPVLPDPLTEEAANALISRLSDAQVRDLLLDQLNAQAVDPADEDAEVQDFFYHATTGALSTLTVAIARLPLLFSEQAKAFSNFAGFLGGDGLLRLLGYLALAVFGALAVELVFRRLVRKWLVLPPVPASDQPLRDKLRALAVRLTGNIVAVGVFMIAAYQITYLFVPQTYHPFILLVGPFLIGYPRMAMAAVQFLMAPENPSYRIVNTDDATARAMAFHNFWLVFLIGLGFVIVPFNAANGVPVGETRIGFWVNTGVHVYLTIVIWRYRAGLVMMMRGHDMDISPVEARIARAFPTFAIVVTWATWWVVNIVASYGDFALLASAPHYKTMFLLFFAPAMDTAIRAAVRHFAPPMTGEGPLAERAHRAATRSYVRIGRVIVFGIVLIAIARFWGMTPGTIASAGVGERIAAGLIRFMMIMSIGYLVYEIVSLYINRKLAAEQTAAGVDPHDEEIGGGDGGGAGGSRLSTVLPLILGVSQAAIVVLFVLLALSNIGVDTTPLLAGAGIVGLAIGFGAQKLVTDVVSGIFFLVDDAFRTGEYVEVEGTMGTVEKISIRSMQLRHHKGPVHTLPYGEIPKITNFSRDWVIMKLRFTVPFGTDPEKVRKLFKKIGQDMISDPAFKDDFLQPFKSQGVFEFDDVGIVIRGKFMARPGTQFTLRKEIFNRVNKVFEDNGLEFARREVRVALPGLADDHKLTGDDRTAIAAAATQAAQDMTPTEPKPEKPGE